MSIPTAKEMAERTKKALDSKLGVILKRIEESLEKAPGYSTTVSLDYEESKMANDAVVRLKELGYAVEYTPGFYEDRPCGGYVSGKLKISWG